MNRPDSHLCRLDGCRWIRPRRGATEHDPVGGFRQIHALEAELGRGALRPRGPSRPVDVGRRGLLRRCRRVLAELDAVAEGARSLKTGQTEGVLRVELRRK